MFFLLCEWWIQMKKSAFTLIEVSAAIVLLAVCMVSFSQLVALATSERTAERIRRTAVDQLQNVMERLAATESKKIIAGDFDKVPIESLIERSLPDGKIVFETKTKDDNNIWIVTVSWNGSEDQPRKKVAMFRWLARETATSSVPE
jgi:prepilin-type N-terminal cleavage/methylation domain-containing protein